LPCWRGSNGQAGTPEVRRNYFVKLEHWTLLFSRRLGDRDMAGDAKVQSHKRVLHT
jgi:hypothetical protein